MVHPLVFIFKQDNHQKYLFQMKEKWITLY